MFLDNVDLLHDMTFVLVLPELRSKKTVIGIIYNQTNKNEDWYFLPLLKLSYVIKYYNHIIFHRRRIPA